MARLPAPPPALPNQALRAPQPIAELAPVGREQAVGDVVRGIVRLPGGDPAAGAVVAVFRALTGWPEWQRERLDEATTGGDGSFQFRVAGAHGLLLGFEHPRFAGGLVDARSDGAPNELQLQPGFDLTGIVRNPEGTVIVGARVAVEGVPGDDRPVVVAVTGNDGRYAFANLPAGPARVVARHPSWQPVAQPAVVLGDQRRVDLQFARPAQASFRGRVVRAGSVDGIAGAVVQLLPLSGKLGLVDAHEARTLADGSFEIGGLARGSMRLFVRHPDFGAVAMTKVVGRAGTAPDSGEEQAGTIVELPRRSLVSGELRGPALAGAASVVLQIRDAAGQLAYAPVDADGRFRFASPLSPGVASLRVVDGLMAFQRSATAEVDVRVEDGPSTRLELLVEKPPIARGRLVDERGAPIAGAEFVSTKLLADNARSLGDAAVQLDLGAIGSQVAQLFAADRERVVARSDADGRFELRGLKANALLRISARGHGTRLVRLESSTQDFGTVVLPPGCRIEGRVRRGGRPVAGATVLVVGSGERAGGELLTQAVVTTNGAGAFRIDDVMPGTYRVRARLPSQPAGTTTLVDARPRAPAFATLTLGSGRRLQGTVVGSDGEPVAGAVVALRGALGIAAVSDERGDFVLEVPDRDIELEVSVQERRAATTLAVPARERQIVARLELPPVCTVTARLFGLPGRRPLPAVVLRFVAADGEGADGRVVWVETPDGELRHAACPTGRGRLEIWCEGYAPVALPEREFLANEVVALGELQLEPGCRLHGVVRDRAGRPVADAVVLLGEESDLDQFLVRARSQADGSFRLQGVSHRSSRLVVHAPGFAPAVVDLELPRDVLSPTPFVVTLDRGTTIIARLAPELQRGGAVVTLRRGGRSVATVEADEAGHAVFPNRGPGRYSLAVVGASHVERPIEVDGAAERVVVALP
jgi:protocatechuate 3,4-dioxygenase beta subunit